VIVGWMLHPAPRRRGLASGSCGAPDYISLLVVVVRLLAVRWWWLQAGGRLRAPDARVFGTSREELARLAPAWCVWSCWGAVWYIIIIFFFFN